MCARRYCFATLWCTLGLLAALAVMALIILGPSLMSNVPSPWRGAIIIFGAMLGVTLAGTLLGAGEDLCKAQERAEEQEAREQRRVNEKTSLIHAQV